MPVIVQPKDYHRWLDPENEEVADIIAPPPSEGWMAYAVNRRVNDPKNDDAKLIEPEPAYEPVASPVISRRAAQIPELLHTGLCLSLAGAYGERA